MKKLIDLGIIEPATYDKDIVFNFDFNPRALIKRKRIGNEKLYRFKDGYVPGIIYYLLMTYNSGLED